MKERQILFSAPMVRALLSRTKTQTRRVVKPQPAPWGTHGWELPGYCASTDEAFRRGAPIFKCRYGEPGALLWVREAWRTIAEADNTKPRDTNAGYRFWYEADAPHQPGFGKLRPGMFMPRWASRITLEVSCVRVERVQDISEADAIAEGITYSTGLEGWHTEEGRFFHCTDPVESYAGLWESINGPGSWCANPWVWVVEFRNPSP